MSASSFSDFVEALARTLHVRAALFADGFTYSIALLGSDERYHLDPAHGSCAPGWDPAADGLIIVNAKTVAALCTGAFNPSHPEADDLFLISGEADALDTLSKALTGGDHWARLRAKEGSRR